MKIIPACGIPSAFFPVVLSALSGLSMAIMTTSRAETGDRPQPHPWMSTVHVPEFSAPPTWREWEARRAEIRATLWKLLGEFPPRPTRLEVKILSREQGPGYVLEKFSFENGLGDVVPGYVFLPENLEGKAPAILYCHWHGGQYTVGKQEMLQTNATPVAAGPTLARRGFVVLGIDAPGFGERNGRGLRGPEETGAAAELTASKFNLWIGRTLWGAILRDDLLALDYLCSRVEVDRRRIGVTGISMGSTRSWWLMALDDRLCAGVAVACLTRYQDLIAADLKAHGIYYFVPGLLQHFDTEAVVACAAPRPLLCLTGDRDPGSPISGVETIGRKVASVYELSGRPAQFENRIYPGLGHVYKPEMWDAMVDWMERHVKNASSGSDPQGLAKRPK